MNIFTNWIFWVVLASILFIFALIGFLSEKKKEKKQNNEVKPDDTVNKPTDILNSNTNNTFTLDSPVQEPKVEEPVTVVETGTLDTSGNATLGDVTTISDSQETISLNNNLPLGENVQIATGDSLTNTQVERNQVNLNTIDVNAIENTNTTQPTVLGNETTGNINLAGEIPTNQGINSTETQINAENLTEQPTQITTTNLTETVAQPTEVQTVTPAPNVTTAQSVGTTLTPTNGQQ